MIMIFNMIKEAKFIKYYYVNGQIIKSYFTMDDKILFKINENQMVIKNYKNEKIDINYDVKTKKFTYYSNQLIELPTEVLEKIYEPYHKDIMKNKVLKIPQPIVNFKQQILMKNGYSDYAGGGFSHIKPLNDDDDVIEIYEWILVDFKAPKVYNNKLKSQREYIVYRSKIYYERNMGRCVAIKKKDGKVCKNNVKGIISSWDFKRMGMPMLYPQCSYEIATYDDKRPIQFDLMFCGCHNKVKARDTKPQHINKKTHEFFDCIGYKIKYGETGYILRK